MDQSIRRAFGREQRGPRRDHLRRPARAVRDDGHAARLRLEQDEAGGLLPPLRRLRGQGEDAGAAHPVAHALAIQPARERHVGGRAFAQCGCQRPVAHEDEAMRAAPHEVGGRLRARRLIVHAEQVAESAHEQDDGSSDESSGFPGDRAGRPPVRIHSTIVHAQPLRIGARTQRDVRQVAGDSQQAGRTSRRPCGCGRSTRPSAATEPRVGISHAASPPGARPSLVPPPQQAGDQGRLMLVDNVRSPRGDRAAQLSQASCLRGESKWERALERAGCDLVDGGIVHCRIGDARRQREKTRQSSWGIARACEREVGRGNQQGSFVRATLTSSTECGRGAGAGMPPS